jgi:hypothetical protein
MEVIVTTMMLAFVLAAMLSPFETFDRVARDNGVQNDAQDRARNTQDAIVFELRNIAGETQLIERAQDYDVVFQTIDHTPLATGSQNRRNVMRVRYCLDTSLALDRGQLWKQTQKWTTAAVPALLPTASCPDTTWGDRRVAAENVVNRAGNAARPVFAFSPAATPLTSITSIRFDLYVDTTPGAQPKETRLTSGVYLRNQNGAPTATFTGTAGAGGTKQMALNGTASADPENLPLEYRWCDMTANALCDDTTKIGNTAQFTYTAPAAGARSIRLTVYDGGGLKAEQTQTLTFP